MRGDDGDDDSAESSEEEEEEEEDVAVWFQTGWHSRLERKKEHNQFTILIR